MTSNRSSVVRSALGLLSMRWIGWQIGLAALVFVLALVWLRIPDASAVDVVGTVLLGLVVLALAGCGEAWLLLRLAQRPRTSARLVLGGIALVVGVALWIGWNALLGHGSESVPTWAGYLNSRFPHGLRNVFSYDHIVLWLGWLQVLLRWLGVGVVAAVVAGLVAGLQRGRAIRGALRSVVYWVVVLAGLWVLEAFSGWLANLTPGHGLAIESVSLVVRMVVLVGFDGVVVAFLLAILVASLLRHDVPAGTPEESQPLTVGNP